MGFFYMNINSYGYSYLDKIGRDLCKPMDNVVSNIKCAWADSGLTSTISLIWHTVIGVIIFIPGSCAWLVGRVVNMCANSRIDYEGLSSRPAQIDLNPVIGDRSKIDVGYLKDCLNYTDTPHKFRESINKIVGKCHYDNENFGTEDVKQFIIFIKAIVKKMKEGNLTNVQKGAIVVKLAEAQPHCFPTWVEAAGKIYFELYGNVESPETKILRIVQEYKEEILHQILQVELHEEVGNDPWHRMNKVREIFGREFGLDMTLKRFDPNVESCGQLSAAEIRYIKDSFYQRFADVNRLVEAVTTRINMGDPNEIFQGYSDLLKDIARNHGIRTERGYNGDRVDDFVTEKCFTEAYMIKPEAVNLMLRQVGLIK